MTRFTRSATWDCRVRTRRATRPDRRSRIASGLQGKLLIIHGTGDDNVHFQGTQRLINKLIGLNKQFSFMEYPNRRHGITGEHLDTLRYGFIEQYLPAGGR